MKCNNCGKEIDEFEIFCDDCKKELKKASSKKDVKELENLIENQKKLNDLENTKELDNLSNLVEEELKKEENILSENEEIKLETKKDNKTKIIIIISSVLFIGIISLVIGLLLTKEKPKEETKEEIINYKKIINEYGNSINNIVKDYVLDNNEVPTWVQVSELNTYEKYDIVCEIHDIYSDGNIYLSSCKVNDKIVNYSYGEKQELKEGKKVQIYKTDYEGNSLYYNTNENNSILVGEVTCKTEDCEYIMAYNKYVLIEEDNLNYLYNYETNSIEFGPFEKNNEYSYIENILQYNNIVYGIYYQENGKNNIYNIKLGKTFKNIKGNLLYGELMFNPNIMYKYNYVVLNNNGKIDFVNLNTGNVSFQVKETIKSFIEDEKNNIVYITAYKENSNMFKLYNSNGKLLFDGKEFNMMSLSNGNLIVSTLNNYYVYDSKLKLKISSKNYENVLGLYKDFIVVLDNNNLKIVDLNDKELTTFDLEWNDNLSFNNMLSGWNTENNKYGIYLVVENKDIPYGISGNIVKYYYIPETNESGYIK